MLQDATNQSFRLILSFGSNLGDRKDNFIRALNSIRELDPTFLIIKQSTWLITTPFQHAQYNTQDHEDYLNFVCEIITSLHPFRFYEDIIVPIENAIGHSRTEKWAPRALDIDILLAALNNQNEFQLCSPLIMDNNFFSLPHKGLLEPERKILQDMLHDALNLTYENIKCHFKPILSAKN